MPELTALSALMVVVYGLLLGFGWAIGFALANALLNGLRR